MKHKLIKRVLMCEPRHFDSLDYVINPWMTPGEINGEKAMGQWKQLVDTYEQLHIKVEIIKQERGNPDMVFSADQGLVKDKKVLLSRFFYAERKNETTYYKEWFEKSGYSIKYLPQNIYFEGNGDSYCWNDKLFIGIGYRADEQTCNAVSKLLNKEVIPLEIIGPKFYHLDVGFLPITNEIAFYYPPAFSEKSRGVLKKLIPHLIEFSKQEAYGFCANSVVTDHHVIHQKGNPGFEKKLKELGYISVPVDTSEFMKSGGGIHCLTNVLEEKSEPN